MPPPKKKFEMFFPGRPLKGTRARDPRERARKTSAANGLWNRSGCVVKKNHSGDTTQ